MRDYCKRRLQVALKKTFSGTWTTRNDRRISFPLNIRATARKYTVIDEVTSIIIEEKLWKLKREIMQ